jgi:hypothetical protein
MPAARKALASSFFSRFWFFFPADLVCFYTLIIERLNLSSTNYFAMKKNIFQRIIPFCCISGWK